MSSALRRPEAAPIPESFSADVPLSLLREIGDLKRIRSAGRDGSIATRLFRSAWASLAAGEDVARVALATAARALAATRLGDLDAPALLGLGLSPEEAEAVLLRGFDEAAAALPLRQAAPLRRGLAGPPLAAGADAPSFVRDLEDQPRAGVTCPGRPRIVLQPAENHAEHCLVVAVYGAVLSDGEGADLATVFLASLSHHLHNAAMPDSGFTGEMLLGPHLDGAVRHATAAALAGLDPSLRSAVEAARRILPGAGTPEGRAFHAADVLDRVLEIEQHLAAARLTMAEVLGPMALVHDGPVKPFHDAVLRTYGLP